MLVGTASTLIRAQSLDWIEQAGPARAQPTPYFVPRFSHYRDGQTVFSGIATTRPNCRA